MSTNDSYFEKCVRALPPEKQEAARAAFHQVAETGDDSFLSKLLVVLEATGAYAKTIPLEMSAVAERLTRDLEQRAAERARTEATERKQRDEHLRAVISEQVPALGRTLAFDKVASALERLAAVVARIERAISRMRHLRVGGVLLLMAISGACAGGLTGAWMWRQHESSRQAQTFVAALQDAGVTASIRAVNEGIQLSIEGPIALRGTAWRKDAKGYISGADFVFPAEESR